MDPKLYLEQAKFLSSLPKGQDTECCIRGSCGRAYYAAFGVAREILAKKFQISYNSTDHGRVVSLLKQSTDVDVQTAGSLIEQLHVTRKSADYDVGNRTPATPFVRLTSQLAVVQADSIITTTRAKQATNARLDIPASVK